MSAAAPVIQRMREKLRRRASVEQWGAYLAPHLCYWSRHPDCFSPARLIRKPLVRHLYSVPCASQSWRKKLIITDRPCPRPVSVSTVGPSSSHGGYDWHSEKADAKARPVLQTRRAKEKKKRKGNLLCPLMEPSLHSPHSFRRQIEVLSELREAFLFSGQYPSLAPSESPGGCPFFPVDHSSSRSSSLRLPPLSRPLFGFTISFSWENINKASAAINHKVAGGEWQKASLRVFTQVATCEEDGAREWVGEAWERG